MQVGHVTVGDGALDLGAILEPGRYVAQVRQPPDTLGVLYATAAVPPGDPLDWFHARGSTYFTFTVGDGALPTWAQAAPTGGTRPPATLALARL